MQQMLRTALVIGMTSGALAPASAQDGSETVSNRTPASAQRFLSMVDGASAGITASFMAKAVKFSSTEACQTQVGFSEISRYSASAGWTPKPGDVQATIDWSKADQVTLTARDSFKFIMIKAKIDEATPWVEIYATSDEMRDRMLAAMKYLQEACDKSKDTGF